MMITLSTSPGKIDPISDIEVINTELALADMASVEKALLRATKAARTGNKDEQAKKDVLEKVFKQLAIRGACADFAFNR